MTPTLGGRGTLEAAWAGWEFGDDSLSPEELSAPVVVLAPHPDDEVLGLGGLLALLAGRGVAVTLVAVTDGEAFAGPAEPETLRLRAEVRARERELAFRELGFEPHLLLRLGLPDGGVAEERLALERALLQLVVPGATVFAPLLRDGHPDHEATAAAALAVSAQRRARLIQYPVWLWHWSAPEDPQVEWRRARRTTLPPPAVGAKRRALGRFRSQLEDRGHGLPAVLLPEMLEHFLRPHETFFL